MEKITIKPFNVEAYALQSWLQEKFSLAQKTNAIKWNSEKRAFPNCKFYLIGTAGAVMVELTKKRNSPVKLTMHLPGYFNSTAELILATNEITITGKQKSEGFITGELLLDVIVPHLMQMEVAPYPRTLYGLVYNQVCVGFTFLRPLSSEERFSKAGYSFDIYVYRDIGSIFSFTYEQNVAYQLYYFWDMFLDNNVKLFGVVPLGRYFVGEYPVNIEAMRESDGRTALLFEHLFLQSSAPKVFTDTPYWAWDAARKNASTTVAPPQEGHISSWFQPG